MAPSVDACAKADAILAGEDPWTLEPASLQGLRFGIPQGLPLRDLDEIVAKRFAEAVATLGRAGVSLSEPVFSLFDDMAAVNSPVPIAVAESYPIHRERLATHADDFDPFVRRRIEAGQDVSATDLAKMLKERSRLVQAMDARLAEIDALVLPTTPIVAPTIAEVSTLDGFNARNRLLLRNTGIANFFDLCAISLPLPISHGLPIGLMLVARHGHDRQLLRMAAALERLLSSR
jgi:aspartyl-tRNA(Asn)/glutamyl-tRNA(Gln) amidotransferase subunit A